MSGSGVRLAGVEGAPINLGGLALAARPPRAPVNVAVAATPVAVRPIVATRPPISAVSMVSTISVGQVSLLDPLLGKALSAIPLVIAGVPRDQITVPISAEADPTDANFYHPVTGTQLLYLPHYGLATQRVSGQEQYWASLAASGNRWAFTLRLNRFADARLGTAARDAAELPHELALLLRYTVPRSGNLQKELIFVETAIEQDVIRGTLYLNSLAEQHELFEVLTDRNAQVMLLARRSIRVAIPVAAPPGAVTGSGGTAILRGTWLFDFHTGTEGTSGDVWWEQVDNSVRKLVPRGQAQIARLGRVDFDSLSLDTLKEQRYSSRPIDGSLSPQVQRRPTDFPVDFDKAPPVVRPPVVTIPSNQLTAGTVLAIKTNAGSYAKVKILEYGYNLRLQWQTFGESAAAGPLYRETTRTLDDSIRLSFDRDLHRYVFADLPAGGGGSAQAGFKRASVTWNRLPHSYYQETTRLNVFHYLPDAFKLARRPQSPHVPLLAFRIETPPESETPTVQFDFSAFRHQDDDRLLHAAKELAGLVPAGQVPVFLPINIDGAKFKLALPRGGLNDAQERPGALVSSRLGVADSITGMPLEDFTKIWDAMADPDGNAVLFQGQVEFKVEGEQKEQIPFVGQLGDMAGDVFDVTYEVLSAATPGGEAGVKATIRNAIESPATIKSLPVQFARQGGASVPGRINAIRPVTGAIPAVLPLTLDEGQTAEIDVFPSAAIPGTEPLTAAFDLTDVSVRPNLERMLKPMALNQLPEFSRPITVGIFADLFKDGVTEIVVEFTRGPRVVFRSVGNQFELTTRVRYSVLDMLAGKPEAPLEYRVVTSHGKGEWTTSDSYSVTITSQDLPKVG